MIPLTLIGLSWLTSLTTNNDAGGSTGARITGHTVRPTVTRRTAKTTVSRHLLVTVRKPRRSRRETRSEGSDLGHSKRPTISRSSATSHLRLRSYESEHIQLG